MVNRACLDPGAIPLNTFRVHSSKVPCDGCTACCEGKGRTLLLWPNLGDNLEDYDHITVEDGNRVFFVLAVTSYESGRCVYLEDKGCSIYNNRPVVCQMYDCRLFVDDEETPIAVRTAARKLLGE